MEKKSLNSTVKFEMYANTICAVKYSTSTGVEELKEQLALFALLPPNIRKRYPEIIDSKIESDPAYYVMKFYPYPTLRELILETSTEATELFKRTQAVLQFVINTQHNWKSQATPPGFLKKSYLDRSRRRLISLAQKHETLKELLETKQLILGGLPFLNPLHIIEQINANKALRDFLEPKHICSTHGQLEFAHILIDLESDDFVLLDPKGPDDFLDMYYDFGKLRQCSHGYLDWIEEGLFEISPPVIKRGVVIIEDLVFRSPERIRTCDTLHHLMHDYIRQVTGEVRSEFELRSAFAEAMHLCSSTPYCYGFGDLNKALACFCRAAIIINDFATKMI